MKTLAFTAAAVASLALTSAAKAEEQVVLYGGSGEQIVEPFQVAVIGAGAGGASSAYHLSKFAASAGIPVNITVFERNPYIGGRSTTVNAYDDSSLPVELGASIFVKVNRILNDAVQAFNLSTTDFAPDADIPGAALAVWDGHELVFAQNGASDWWDTAKLLWKYGLAPIRTIRLMRSTVAKFLQMYDEPLFPWESLTQVAQDTGLLAVTAATGSQYLAENGIGGDFGWDVVQASTRVNYAQNLQHIHALEAMVCMAAENAESVSGGNWRIFERMLAAANATTLLQTQVERLEKQEDGCYVLHTANLNGGHPSSTLPFDAVILAAPYQHADIDPSPAPAHTPDKIPYVELHVTLFTSPHLLSPAFFHLPPDKPAPRVVLTTLPKTEQPRSGPQGCGSPGFFSISLLRPVTNPKTSEEEYLYKIFSPSPPNATFLSRLLGLQPTRADSETETEIGVSDTDITWIHRKVWHSYPYEYPRVTFENVQLDETLWYTSGIESFISTMETSALSGMNVARLVVDRWRAGMDGTGARQGEMETPGLATGA